MVLKLGLLNNELPVPTKAIINKGFGGNEPKYMKSKFIIIVLPSIFVQPTFSQTYPTFEHE
jgi:hypothetical protein